MKNASIKKGDWKSQEGGVGAVVLVTIGMISFFAISIIIYFTAMSHMVQDFPATKIAERYLKAIPELTDIIGEVQHFLPLSSSGFSYNQKEGKGILNALVTGKKDSALVQVTFSSENGEFWFMDRIQVSAEGQAKPVFISTPKDLMQYSQNALRTGNLENAIKVCEFLTSAFPDYYYGAKCFGNISLHQGDVEVYIRFHHRLTEARPKYFRYQEYLADAYYKTGQYKKSLEHYERAHSLNPNAFLAGMIGVLHTRMGNLVPAQEYIMKALEIEPRNPLYLSWLGFALYKMEKYTEAEKIFKEALRIDENLPEAYLGMGGVLREQGRTPEAIYFFEQAIARAPDDTVDNRISVAELFAQNEDYDSALYHLKKVLQNNPNNLEVILYLEALHLKNGNPKQAAIYRAQRKKLKK